MLVSEMTSAELVVTVMASCIGALMIVIAFFVGVWRTDKYGPTLPNLGLVLLPCVFAIFLGAALAGY